ncbi:uncharacterized protein LOC112082257 isoform X1 [Eutrema salsugineum]|uniref:uncharacterized protein LOC112082257 isoform X1 n=1 Tax=Eutrema salsugineum TaxID=72664 RepID=UPI000CED30DA|nr:uncharacterized protein LOC112082257 isoform X1 [Eutrema salsugineum]
MSLAQKIQSAKVQSQAASIAQRRGLASAACSTLFLSLFAIALESLFRCFTFIRSFSLTMERFKLWEDGYFYLFFQYMNCWLYLICAGNHGDAKVNFWKDPMNPGNWKDEQFMLIGSGLFCYGGYKFFNSDTVRETYRNEEARNLLLAAIFEK